MSKKKFTVLFLLIVFWYFIYSGLKVFKINNISDLFLHKTALEQICYVIQIIVGIAAVIGAVIGVWQYVLTARCERAKMKNDRVEKAINLSEYYKNNILTDVAALRFVFETSGITEILSKIRVDDMENFDSDELNDLLSSADIKKLSQIMKSKEMAQCIIITEKVYGVELGVDKCVNITTVENGKQKVEMDTAGLSRMFMSQIVNKLLNNMEYFAMSFTHKVADESVVFQSLHQTYLEAVQLLYYDISKNNRADGRQFYTNVVDLYKIWYNKGKENRENVIKGGRKISKGTSAESIDL